MFDRPTFKYFKIIRSAAAHTYLAFGLSFLLCIHSGLNAQFLDADAPTGGIRINQVGYGTNDIKSAILDSYLFPGQHHPKFYLIALNQFADTVYQGNLQPTGEDLYSKKANFQADFSAFNQPGHYYLSIPGQGTSYPFHISDYPYHNLLKAAAKALYFNRASLALTEQYAGQWARPEGHPDTAVHIHASAVSAFRTTGNTISSPGGWYDAGDYNKYIVNASITMNTLLCALEEYPAFTRSLKTNIPPYGNSKNQSIPDLLNEIMYNLHWMLTMQDPNDGGVYHKLSSAKFDPMEMPDKDHDKRYVVQKSTAATLDFISVMATAATLIQDSAYRKAFPGLVDRLKKAATDAWGWATSHPAEIYNQQRLNRKFKPKIKTGAYEDGHLQDEWYLAACSMFLLTGDSVYIDVIESNTPDELTIPTWNNVAAIGSILLSRLKPDSIEQRAGINGTLLAKAVRLQQSSEANIIRLADRLIHQKNPGFNTVMGGRTTDFTWGSNANAANQGWILMEAYRLTSNRPYRDAALGNLDYLLGRNATGYSFVTGFGTLSPLHPHHRISTADKIDAPVPGFLVGGPNPGSQDGVKFTHSHRADLAYIDNDQAYSVNEVAINWNAPLIYLIIALEATSQPGR